MKLYNTRYSQVTYKKVSGEERDYYATWDDLCERIYMKYPENTIKNFRYGKSRVYLTFDDAPDKYCTEQILDILSDMKVKASFSIIGSYIDDNIELLRRIQSEGHCIINHTMRHLDLTNLTGEEIEKEINETEKKLFTLLGMECKLLRPPFGKIDMRVADCIIEKDYNIALWSYNTCDWVAATQEEITEGLTDSIWDGDVILLHSYENKENTVAALPHIITELRMNDFGFGTLNEW